MKMLLKDKDSKCLIFSLRCRFKVSVLTCRGHWSSWPCKTEERQTRGSSETVAPAASHTPPPLSVAPAHEHKSVPVHGLTNLIHFNCCLRTLTSRTSASTASQGEGNPEGTMGHWASRGSTSTQLFPNISTS